jgi:hypothetical protein
VLRGEIYYAREHEPPRLGRRTFGGSRGDLVLTISYAKPLRPGHSTMLHVSFHYLGRYPLNRPIELRAFRLISMPAVSHRNGYQPFGHPDTLAVRTYTGWRLGDRETRADSLRIRPSIRAKFVEFRFEWDSIDSDGECHSSAWLQLQDQE